MRTPCWVDDQILRVFIEPSRVEKLFVLQEVLRSLTEARSRRWGCKSEKSCIQKEKKAEGRIQMCCRVSYRPSHKENREIPSRWEECTRRDEVIAHRKIPPRCAKDAHEQVHQWE